MDACPKGSLGETATNKMARNKTHNKNTHQAPLTSFNVLPWIAGAVFVLGLAALAGIYRDRTMTVKNVRFEGHYFVSQQELENKIRIPTGIKPDSLDFLGIIKQVEEIPYVKYADVQIEPGGDLLIEVTERQAMALLANGNDKIYVDEDGIRLKLILGKNVDVPILYGFKTKPMSDTLRSKAFFAVRNFLTEMKKHRVSNATISEVAWTNDQGVVALTHENGVKLVFGKNDFKTRLRSWEAFYKEIIKTKGIASMQSVDLRFRDQIVTQES